MTLVVLLTIAAVLSLAGILWIAVSRSLSMPAGSSLSSQIYPLDVEAFRNLADPAEDEYLRRRLSAFEFRRVRRARLRALAAYVRTAARNAAVLLRMGKDALAPSDAPTAEAAAQLVNQAFLLRRHAALALVRIYGAIVWPSSNLLATAVLDGYRQLSSAAMILGRLQNPAAPIRISVR